MKTKFAGTRYSPLIAREESHEVGTVVQFRRRLLKRLKELSDESGKNAFRMPVGLFLVVDRENGGDATAQELTSRFNLIDLESRNVIDFYFLGWSKNSSGNIAFDPNGFSDCRNFLKQSGIKEFGGNADLILVDAVRHESGSVTLDFQHAIRIDLSTRKAEKGFPTLGSFLESIIAAAQAVKDDVHRATATGTVFAISDRLGIAIAKDSILNFILEKWGKIIGARKLKELAVTNLGPSLEI
jgi:hypothetical protein